MKKSHIITAAFLLIITLLLKDEIIFLAIALMWFAVNMVFTKQLLKQWDNGIPGGWLLLLVVILWIAFALFLSFALSFASSMRFYREKNPTTTAAIFYQTTSN